VVSVAKVVIGRAREHCRTEGAGTQGATSPGERRVTGQEGRGRGEGRDRRQLGAAGSLGGWAAAERLLKRIRLQTQRSGSGIAEIVGAVRASCCLLLLVWARRRCKRFDICRLVGFQGGVPFRVGLGVCESRKSVGGKH
jgi:hypothetical protein